MFIYNTYWRTWNRVLLDNYFGQCIEISLTHINGDWNGVKEERIRVHRTARKPGESLVYHLPPQVKKDMTSNLGEVLTEKLTKFDYLPNINWYRYAELNNGGAPFAQIVRVIS